MGPGFRRDDDIASSVQRWAMGAGSARSARIPDRFERAIERVVAGIDIAFIKSGAAAVGLDRCPAADHCFAAFHLFVFKYYVFIVRRKNYRVPFFIFVSRHVNIFCV